jgi:hypothetical protein
MFVTAQNFDDYPYNLPDLDNVENSFQDFVDLEEEEMLYRVLGRLLYEEFKVHMLALVDDPIVPLPDRWAKLLNGTTYTYRGRVFRWLGMVKLITPYIYSRWTTVTSDSHNGAGITVPKTENSTVISPGQRISRAHNVFSRMSGHNRSMVSTLYGYLYNSGDVYLDVVVSENATIQEYIRLNYQDPKLVNMFNL